MFTSSSTAERLKSPNPQVKQTASFKKLSTKKQISNVRDAVLKQKLDLDQSHLNHYLSIHVIHKPSNAVKIQTFFKTINKSDMNKSTLAKFILQNVRSLFSPTQAVLALQNLINDFNRNGLNKTNLFNRILFNYVITPVFELSKSNSQVHTKLNSCSTMIKKVFSTPKSLHPALHFAQKVKKEYLLLVNAFCPVTAIEFKSLNQGLSLFEASRDLRIFLSMKNALAHHHQEELFIFIENLTKMKSKQHFDTINLEIINISANEKEIIQAAIKNTFSSDKPKVVLLKKQIIQTISKHSKTMWTGMKGTYLETLPYDKE